MLAFAPTSSFARPVQLRSSSLTPHSLQPRRALSSRARAARSLVHAPRAQLTASKIANKSYQLEEDEDNMSCTTAVYLNSDGTLTVGRTDGPRPDRVDASWRYSDPEGELTITIERFFEEDATPFSVKRVLRGHLDDGQKNLEGLPVFTGAMYKEPVDFSPHSEIGWFAMIVATDDLPNDNFDISAL